MKFWSGVIGVAGALLIILSAAAWAESPWYWLDKGIEYSSQGKYRKAIRCDTKAIELAPDWAWAYYYRAIDYADAGRSDDAIDDYTRAVTLDPEFRDAYYNRGIVYDEMGRYGDAVDDLSLIHISEPTRPY